MHISEGKMMQVSAKISLIVSGLLVVGAAQAQESVPGKWTHADAGMGQYEGGVSDLSGDARINYSCSSFGADVTFWAKGLHIAAGTSKLMVDGKEIPLKLPDTNYSARNDQTSFDISAKPDYGPNWKGEVNAVISALAGGKEAEWVTPNGENYTFPLAGSSAIKSCKM